MSLFHIEHIIPFLIILVVVAFLYASVGHGGASGYLALMAIFAFPPEIMKPTALLLNIFVAGVSFWFFKKSNYFKPRLFWPFAIASIPAAFIGGYITIDAFLYKRILGVLLVFAVLRIMGVFGKSGESKEIKIPLALLIGFCIGFFSGMIGIGGGIILSPVILLLGWGNVKEAAAVSALFIFVNSIAGMSGFLLNSNVIPGESVYLVPVALAGGTLGAFYGSNKFSFLKLKYVLSAVLMIASIKLLTI
ncbi:sulfite exporter TauE/SafE family protein [Abyssalbus ytuae]|uniref:Probable membrane transporter protein n=1 Tax=Abyssalbus ytuae TaxID=2926907 RepID=A0A9E7A1M2_9FLAO|nr:sulfite exporter TauE/SafE family protein [Abyssalbus ytuae]UOB18066.1 sulfite exporter TauE/SafE family protein [Abyssalbus ytuae]